MCTLFGPEFECAALPTRSKLFLAPLVTLALSLVACRSDLDQPIRPLDAQYHGLPQSIVDGLQHEVPPSPDGKPIWCLDEKDDTGQYVGYCICYNLKACGELWKSGRCDGQIGIVRPDVGVCRERIEAITIG